MNGLRTDYGVGVYATGEAHFALERRVYRPDATKRGVLCFHGASDNALSPHTKPYGTGPSIPEALAQLGYPVLSCDDGGLTPWANDTAIARAGDAFAFLTSSSQGRPGAKTDKVALFGASMGAANALNWAKSNLSKVAAIALGIPAVDMKDIYDNNRGPGLQTTIANAYGGDAGWQAAEPTHNPMEFAAIFAGIPIACWYASDDLAIFPPTVVAFQAAVGATCEIHSLGAVGHTPQALPTADVVAFLGAHL